MHDNAVTDVQLPFCDSHRIVHCDIAGFKACDLYDGRVGCVIQPQSGQREKFSGCTFDVDHAIEYAVHPAVEGPRLQRLQERRVNTATQQDSAKR